MSKKDKIWIFILLIIVIFQYREIIFYKKIFFIRDLTYIFQPWKSAVCESLINGKMPLWNPYSYCGMPLLANFQTAVFYPFSIFFYIFGFIFGLKLFTVIHTFLAALFLFLYLRNNKLKTIPSFTAGVVFAFGGYLITKTEFLSLMGTAIWLPLILLLSGNIPICSLAISISLFAGYPPVLFFIMIFLLVETLTENKVKKFASIMPIVIIVSAIQILPSLELILNSVRQSGLKISDAIIWSANYSDLLALISPLFLKIEVTGLFTGEKFFWIKSCWIGFTAFSISIIGIFYISKKSVFRNRKKMVLYFLLIIFSLLFAVGDKTPFYSVVHHYIPGFNLIRYPAHILFIPFFIFVTFTATGLNNLGKISPLFSFLIAVEILFYCQKIHPTIAYNFYKETGLVAGYLQKDKGFFRFFSTPKTSGTGKIKIPDYGDIGWYVLKDRLTGITSIPFHLFDAGGIGEPLEIKQHADMISEIQKKKDPDDANELLSKMNVKYLLSDYYFQSKLWTLSYRSHLFVYKNENFIERSFVEDDENNQRKKAKIVYYSPEKIIIKTASSGKLVLLDTFYPGWQVYVNGHKTDIKKANGIFRSIKLSGTNNYKVFFLYNPVLFGLGLLISLLSICIMLFCDIHSFTRF